MTTSRTKRSTHPNRTTAASTPTTQRFARSGRYPRRTSPMAALLLIAAVAACSPEAAQPVDAPPGLSSIDLQIVHQAETIEVPFAVDDEDPATVEVTASALDSDLVPDAGLELVGSGADRSLRITPDPTRTGGTRITLHATDAQGNTASAGFVLAVQTPFQTSYPALAAGDADPSDGLGAAVSIHGDHAILGAPWDDGAAANAGAAYIFQHDGDAWTQVAKLTAGDATPAHAFGFAVAIGADHAVVGAYKDPEAGGYTGAAYVFERDGASWTEVAKLTASDAASESYFGYAVAIDGDRIVVGAKEDDALGDNAGAAYVFRRAGDGWKEEAKLTAGDASSSDEFGQAVAIHRDQIVVGAHYHETDGIQTGAAYVYRRTGSGWIEIATLLPSDGDDGDVFGYAVALDGDTAVVGARGYGEPSTGAAYVFRRTADGWTESAKLTVDDPEAGVGFATSVAIDGDDVVVGAPWGTGAAYGFRRNGDTWFETARLTAPGAETDADFGESVAIHGDHLLVGAPSTGATDTGAAYLFPK